MRWTAPLRANTRPCRCGIGKGAATILCGPNTIRLAMSGCATTAGCSGSAASTRPVGPSYGRTIRVTAPGRFRSVRAGIGFQKGRPPVSGEVAVSLLVKACRPAHPFEGSLVGNLLCLAQVATGRVVPFTGLLSLLDFDVESEVEPFQTAARTLHLKVGRVAIGFGYGVVSDAAKLGTEGTVESTVRFGLPHERCLGHSS